MPFDNTDVAFSSAWDIDKVVDFQDSSTNPSLAAAVGVGSTATVTVANTYDYRPRLIAQYKPSTQGKWYEPGENLQFSSSQLVEMTVWVGTSDFKFTITNNHGAGVTVEVRYWVRSDGI